MIKYQAEPFDQIWDEAMPLAYDQYEELSAYPDIPFNPSRETYEGMAKAGVLRCYTARKEEVLIGYAVFMVAFNPHYSGSLQAMQDVFYLDPDHRKGRTGLRLVRFSDDMLREEGVQVVYQHVKPEHPQLGRLLMFEGYEPGDQLFSRRLDDGH